MNKYGLRIAFCAVALLFAGYGYPEDNGLAAYWDFDHAEANTVKDMSGNGNDGVIHGAAWTEGVKGKALEFDGKSYVDCGNGAGLNIRDAITMEAWVRVNGTEYYRIVTKGSAADAYNMYVGRNRLSTDIAGGFAAGSVPAGKWVHVAVTFDGSLPRNQVKGYINGKLVGERDRNTPIAASESNVRIGADSRGSFAFLGTIDEIRIYNRALKEEEINRSYRELGELTIEREKEEKELQTKKKIAEMRESYSKLKNLLLPEGRLLDQTDFSIPQRWIYHKLYKLPFYVALPYNQQLWKASGMENEPLIADSLVFPVYTAHLSSPQSATYQQLLQSGKPFISASYNEEKESVAQKIREDFGDRWIGNFGNMTQEWTRLWVPSRDYVMNFVKEAGFSDLPSNRKQALEMAGTLLKKRFAKYTPGQKQFNIQATVQDHFAMSLPEISVEGVEMGGQCGQNPAQLASARGASRQYRKPWAAYIESFYSPDGPTSYDFPFPECSSSLGEAHYRTGPFCGMSPSLHKRMFYASYMGGANLLIFEMHTKLLLAGYDFRTIGQKDHLTQLLSDRQYFLSPVGFDLKEFYDNVVKKRDRGIPYTPVGLLFDKYHNLDTPYSMDWGMGMVPYADADYMMRAVINNIWPWEEGKFNPERGTESYCMVTSAYGDIFDIVTNDSATLDNLCNYPVLFLVGNVDIDETLYNKLTFFVRDGGILFINAAQVNSLFSEDFLGVKLTGRHRRGDSFFSLLDGHSDIEANGFDFQEVVTGKGRSIVLFAESGHTYPLVTENSYGKGKVFLTTPSYLYEKGSKNRMLNLFTYLMHRISMEATPIAVQGDVEYSMNRNKNNWVVTLINNEGVTKMPFKPAATDTEKQADVRITFRNGFTPGMAEEWLTGDKIAHSAGSFSLTVPPGEVRIVEFGGGSS